MSLLCWVSIGYFGPVAACASSTFTPTQPLGAEHVAPPQAACGELFGTTLLLARYLTREGVLSFVDAVVRHEVYEVAAVAHFSFGMSAIDQAHRAVLFPVHENPDEDREALVRSHLD